MVTLLTSSWSCVWDLFPFYEPRHLYRNEEALWPSSHRTPHEHQAPRRQPVAERSRCSSIRRRWGIMSSSNIEKERDVKKGRGMGLWKWLMGAQMAELWSGGKWRGGRETRDNADSWAGLPVRLSLVFRLDLQVLDGTLAGAGLENKNRCHKIPLRLGFASVMTPLEMLRVWCSQQKTCQTRPEWYSSPTQLQPICRPIT